MKFLAIALYHGCGRCYLDGTNKLIAGNKGCTLPTNNPFWKRPEDSSNRISKSTRSKLKKRHMQLQIIAKNISVMLNLLIQEITNFCQPMNEITVQTKTVQATLKQTYQINCQTIIKSM